MKLARKAPVFSFCTLFTTFVVALFSTHVAAAGAASDCAGDGKQDATACLQAHLDRGGVQLLPGKTYLTTKSLSVGAHAELDGNNATITTPSPVRAIIIAGDGASVHDLTLVGSDPTADGIFIAKGASNVAVRNNQVTGNFRQAILLGASGQHDLIIEGNKVFPGKGQRIAFGVIANPSRLARDGGTPPRNIAIRNNVLTDLTGDAIEINSPPPVSVSNLQIEGNTLSAPLHQTSTAGFCIGMAGVVGARIVGNKIANCKWQGIHIEHNSTNILIQDNSIDKTIGPSGIQMNGRRNSAGILLLNSSNIKIYRNRIIDTYNSGIELAWNPKGTNSNITIAGNVINRAGDYGIHVGGPAGRDMGVIVGAADGFGANQITGSKLSPFAGCNSSIRGSDVRLANCAQQK